MTWPNTTTVATAFKFAALNRTVWTARKQSLSGNAGGGRQNEPADPGTCDLCGAIEDMAHILTDCKNYSYRLWERFGRHLTATCRTLKPDCGMILVTFSNIMYFTQITGLPPPHAKHILALLIELKRDIYVRRTERCLDRDLEGDHPERIRRIRIYTDQRLDMHISIACSRIVKMIELKGKDAGILNTIRDICLAT
jgi:hypothetical protein